MGGSSRGSEIRRSEVRSSEVRSSEVRGSKVRSSDPLRETTMPPLPASIEVTSVLTSFYMFR